jgi:DNA-binding IclR family transcriptional regulator
VDASWQGYRHNRCRSARRNRLPSGGLGDSVWAGLVDPECITAILERSARTGNDLDWNVSNAVTKEGVSNTAINENVSNTVIIMMQRHSSSVRPSRQLATSLFKALDVLSAVAQNASGVTMADLTHTLPLPRTSILRILQSLETYGLIEREGRSFRVTSGFHAWTSPDPCAALRQRMRARLERLSRELKELIVLGVAEGNRLRHVDFVEFEHQLVVRPGLVLRHPLHRSAMGKLLLSQRPDLCARLKDAALLSEIDEARRVGHAWNRGETESGIIAVAAWAEPASPISAMIAVNWPTFRFSESKAVIALRAIAAQ